MPFKNPFKKNKNIRAPLEIKNNLAEAGDSITKQEYLEALLEQHNLSELTERKFEQHITKGIYLAKATKNKNLEIYFTHKKFLVNKFINLLYSLNEASYRLTTSNSQINEKERTNLIKINKSLSKCVQEYTEAKSKLKDQSGFEDTKYNLTIEGLVC